MKKKVSREPVSGCPLWRRLAAMSYDALLVTGLLMVAAAIVVIPSGTGIRAGHPAFQLYLLVAWWLYFAVCWRSGGQTLGMRAWRIRLVADTPPFGWGDSAIRFIAAIFSALALGLGFAWSLIDPKRLTWHDRLSNSRLIVATGPSSVPRC